MKPLFDGVENANQTQLKPIMRYNHDIFLGGGVKNIYPPPTESLFTPLGILPKASQGWLPN